MKNRMKRSNKNRIWIVMMLTAVVTVSVWMAEAGTAYAVTQNGAFIAGGETVYASLSGDAGGVTAQTSYTKGPGEVGVWVHGQAKVPGESNTVGVTCETVFTNTPGGISRTITPPAGGAFVSAVSHHYATINGESRSYDIALF